MTQALTAERSATDVPLELLVNNNGGVTGLSAIVAIRDGDTDDSYLDFSDATFKAAGWTLRQAPMTEISAANAPGKYVRRLDVAAITNLPAASDNLIAEYSVSGSVLGVAQDTVQLIQSFLDVPADVHDDALSGHTGAGTAGRALLMALYLGKIWIDTGAAGSPGSVLGVNGTEGNPVDNLADALLLTTALGTRTLSLSGSIELDAPMNDFTVLGSSRNNTRAIVALGGQNIDCTVFVGCAISGTMAGKAVFDECFLNAIVDLHAAVAVQCFIGQTGVILAGSGSTRLVSCGSSSPVAAGAPIAFSGTSHSLIMKDFEGPIALTGMTNANHRALITMRGREISVDGTDGLVTVSGIGELVDGGGGTVIDAQGLVLQSEIAEGLDWAKNRRRIDFVAGPPRQLVLYERDGVTEMARMDLTTTNGTEVLAFFGVQHERGVPV